MMSSAKESLRPSFWLSRTFTLASVIFILLILHTTLFAADLEDFKISAISLHDGRAILLIDGNPQVVERYSKIKVQPSDYVVKGFATDKILMDKYENGLLTGQVWVAKDGKVLSEVSYSK